MEITVLTTTKENGASGSATLVLSDQIVMGRDPSSKIQLNGVGISREHFALINKDGAVFLQDLSSNGTWLNGKQLIRQNLEPVQDGDVIGIPGYELELTLPKQRVATSKSSPESLPVPAIEAVQQRRAAAPLSQYLAFFTWSEMFVIGAAVCSFLLIWYCASY
jgi:pSer/pThr/pTyr-binding forkhead associated (FHA) protein